MKSWWKSREKNVINKVYFSYWYCMGMSMRSNKGLYRLFYRVIFVQDVLLQCFWTPSFALNAIVTIIAHNARVLWVISLQRNFKSGNVIRLYLTASVQQAAAEFDDSVLCGKDEIFLGKFNFFLEFQILIRLLFTDQFRVSIYRPILLYLGIFGSDFWYAGRLDL